MDRIDKLREITGNPALDFQEDDLETDFDPQKHDEMMQVIVGLHIIELSCMYNVSVSNL